MSHKVLITSSRMGHAEVSLRSDSTGALTKIPGIESIIIHPIYPGQPITATLTVICDSVSIEAETDSEIPVPAAVLPYADGWIENTGAIPACEQVHIRLRSDTVSTTPILTENLVWRVSGVPSDIVAYLPYVEEPAPQVEETPQPTRAGWTFNTRVPPTCEYVYVRLRGGGESAQPARTRDLYWGDTGGPGDIEWYRPVVAHEPTHGLWRANTGVRPSADRVDVRLRSGTVRTGIGSHALVWSINHVGSDIVEYREDLPWSAHEGGERPGWLAVNTQVVAELRDGTLTGPVAVSTLRWPWRARVENGGRDIIRWRIVQ